MSDVDEPFNVKLALRPASQPSRQRHDSRLTATIPITTRSPFVGDGSIIRRQDLVGTTLRGVGSQFDKVQSVLAGSPATAERQ